MYLSVLCTGLVFVFLFFIYFNKLSRVSFFNPVFLLFLIYFHGVFLRFFFGFHESIDKLWLGVISMLLFLIFFSLGFFLAFSKYISIGSGFRHLFGVRAFAIILSVVLVALFFKDVNSFGARFILDSGGERTSNFVYLWGADILFGIFILQMAYVYDKGGKLKPRYYAALLVALLVYAAISARFSMILYIAMVSFVYIYYRSDFRIYFIGLVSVLIVFVGFGLLRDYRQGGGASPNMILFEQLLYLPYLLDVNKTGTIIEYFYTRSEFLHGTTFFYIILDKLGVDLLSFPPRSFIAKEVFGRTNDSGIPPGVVAELYMNFSWLGVAVGGFVVGYLSKVFFNTLRVARRPFVVVVYAIFINAFFLLVTVDFQSAFIATLKIVVPVVVLDGYCRKYFSSGGSSVVFRK